jgi:predicted O-linked N-acetylglucosamine transferase (SPINDLY family)
MVKQNSRGRGRPSGPEVKQAIARATAAHQAGRLDEAELLYRSLLATDKKDVQVLQMLGLLTAQSGRYDEAERLLRDALRLKPNDAGWQFNHGNVLVALGRFDDAMAAFDKTLALNPRFADAHLNTGGLLIRQKRFADAVACFDAAIAINPAYAAAHSNRGYALEELRRFDDALASHAKAVSLDPRRADLYAARANVLHKLKRFDEALADIAQALALAPGNAEFLYNRGNILYELKRYDDAFAAYDAAYHRDPGLDFLEGDRLFTKLLICDWTRWEAETSHLASAIAAGRPAVRPFSFLPVPASPPLQLACAKVFTQRQCPPVAPLWQGRRYEHDRIRLAYLSADFREHPVAHLIAGVIEHHDRARFETVGVSFGADDAGPLRTRIERAFERFLDVGGKSDAEIAQLLHEAEIDIAVDLMGPTQGARPEILSYRPAPIQAIYLGYAGSSGAGYIDYIIADQIVIPDGEQQFYSEKIAYLPDTYMATDSRRAIAAHTPSRAEQGLPEGGVVFCSFNNSYKITPPVFDVWMRLLREIDGSVLWLSHINDAATANLRREADARGIRPERLVFAPRVALNEDHLARYRLADLFLDTQPFGAHSTASDALWAGVPVLTCAGSTFASRVATSLLHAIGLDELVTASLPDYEALALTLARDRTRLDAIHARIAERRASSPLFDTERFARNLEAAYTTMCERYRRGEPPAPITLPASPA